MSTSDPAWIQQQAVQAESQLQLDAKGNAFRQIPRSEQKRPTKLKLKRFKAEHAQPRTDRQEASQCLKSRGQVVVNHQGQLSTTFTQERTNTIISEIWNHSSSPIELARKLPLLLFLCKPLVCTEGQNLRMHERRQVPRRNRLINLRG